MTLPLEPDVAIGPTEPLTEMRTIFGTRRVCQPPSPHRQSPDEILSNPRIAIIDDQSLNIRVVQRHLSILGYRQFFTTTDATEALELIRQQQPDVVLLDIMMPEISGLEILRLLRSDEAFEGLPVIILTAATRQRDRS